MQQAGGYPFVAVRMADGRAEMSGACAWQSGPGFERPVGRLFAQWDWDGTTLSAEVDPFGFFNLYVYEKAGAVIEQPHLSGPV